MATLGGGLVGGDDIQLTADVMADARALVTTQASTKVYRSLRPSTQSVTARVGERALLAVLPDPVVCFADADFVQNQRYDLAPDASLVVVDWMTSGRHAAGERWKFSRYESRIDVTRGAQAIVFDAIVLEPNLDLVADRMDRFDVVVTAVLTGPLVAAAIDGIARRIEQPVTGRSDLVASVARLRDGGALLRMAGVNVEHVGRSLREQLAFLAPLIGDDLWSRKW
jgi:urease accessory protein